MLLLPGPRRATPPLKPHVCIKKKACGEAAAAGPPRLAKGRGDHHQSGGHALFAGRVRSTSDEGAHSRAVRAAQGAGLAG